MSPAVQDHRNSQSDAAGGKSTNPASDKSSGARNGGARGESRIACFQVLRLVDNGRYLDEALRQARHLPDRDRRFVRLLAATCLRRAGQIDSILADLMSRQPSGKQRDAMIILRMGAAQLLRPWKCHQSPLAQHSAVPETAPHHLQTDELKVLQDPRSRHIHALGSPKQGIASPCPAETPQLAAWRIHTARDRTERVCHR